MKTAFFQVLVFGCYYDCESQEGQGHYKKIIIIIGEKLSNVNDIIMVFTNDKNNLWEENNGCEKYLRMFLDYLGSR